MALEKTSMERIDTVQSLRIGEIHASELRQDFNLWSTLGIAFSYIATPLSIGSYLAFSLSAGGSPYFFYGYVLVFFMNTLVALSLCEMAGFLPHTAGTYHLVLTSSISMLMIERTGQIFWTSRLAPPSAARLLSYVNGGLTMMAWLFWTAGTLLFSAQLTLVFAALCGADFEQKDWHVFLLYLAFTAYGFFANTVAFKAIPTVSRFMIGYINIGAVFVLISLLVRSNPKPSAKTVFVDIVNETGWSSNGLVFFLSLLPGVTAINGFDSAAHLSDELPHPAKQVPQVMIGTVLLCGLAGLPMIISFLFSIVDAKSLLTSQQPIFQLLHDSLDSRPLFVIAGLIYLGVFTFACGSIVTTLSRCWWSFTKSGATPWHDWQGRISKKLTLPINSIIVVMVIEILIGLLIFGPATVLSGLVGSAAICFYLSYTMPILCFLLRGRRGLPPNRYFNLGRVGPVVNAISVAWASMMAVFLCFPVFVPVTGSLMNYASVVVAVGIIVWGVIWVLYARNHYVIPEALYAEELHGQGAIAHGEDTRDSNGSSAGYSEELRGAVTAIAGQGGRDKDASVA